MAIKTYKPVTPGRRGMTVTDYSVLSKVEPERSLLESLKKNSGRNSYGRITVRHKGGAQRRAWKCLLRASTLSRLPRTPTRSR